MSPHSKPSSTIPKLYFLFSLCLFIFSNLYIQPGSRIHHPTKSRMSFLLSQPQMRQPSASSIQYISKNVNRIIRVLTTFYDETHKLSRSFILISSNLLLSSHHRILNREVHKLFLKILVFFL